MPKKRALGFRPRVQLQPWLREHPPNSRPLERGLLPEGQSEGPAKVPDRQDHNYQIADQPGLWHPLACVHPVRLPALSCPNERHDPPLSLKPVWADPFYLSSYTTLTGADKFNQVSDLGESLDLFVRSHQALDRLASLLKRILYASFEGFPNFIR